jgi:zinc finger protein
MAAPSELRVDALCPACRSTGLVLRTLAVEVPYFGEALETFLRCEHCGFRHTDFLVLAEHAPVRWSIPIRADTLGARVVRSSSGTWRIPELGFAAEPTTLSEAFVTNVEGMLDRARRVVLQARLLNEGDGVRTAVADSILVRIDRILAGAETATLIVEDPLGNSAISHDAAAREELAPEEAAALKSGTIVFDKGEMDVEDEPEGPGGPGPRSV